MLTQTLGQVVLWACVAHAAPDKFLSPFPRPAAHNTSANESATTDITKTTSSHVSVFNTSASVDGTMQVSRGSPVNLCWPPHAYASIADLGWADGFTNAGYTIENILSSSGGTCSALLLLADPYLKSSLGKQQYLKAYNDFWFESDTYVYWKREYERILKADWAAFQRVKKGSKVALKCWDTSGTGHNIVLYNFVSPEQAAQAHAAAGDPGCHFVNCPVDGVWGHTANCADFGGWQVDAGFKSGQASGNEIYYYNTKYLIDQGYGAIGYVDELIKIGQQDYNGWKHSSYYGPAKANTGYQWVDLR